MRRIRLKKFDYPRKFIKYFPEIEAVEFDAKTTKELDNDIRKHSKCQFVEEVCEEII